MKELEARHYLDDRVFALTWAQKVVEHRQLGPLALRTGLHLKGIDREIIEEVLQKIYGCNDEEQVAQRAIKKRLEGMRPGLKSSALGRNLGGYLARKGFTPGVIEKVLRSTEQQPQDPEAIMSNE
jgi:regulatory protein